MLHMQQPNEKGRLGNVDTRWKIAQQEKRIIPFSHSKSYNALNITNWLYIAIYESLSKSRFSF